MTQLRKFPDDISNYFDEIEKGIGKRGSSFSNLDAVSHDGDKPERFLFREFKHESEDLDPAQKWALEGLARLPRCTVLVIRKLNSGIIELSVFMPKRNKWHKKTITVSEYQSKIKHWWFPDA